MDVDEFVSWLCCRDRDEIEAVVHALEADRETADGEVGRLRATRELGSFLRRSGKGRQAGVAVHRATAAAREACTTSGMCESDPGHVTLVARAAGDAALGLVAGEHNASTDAVLRPFRGAMVTGPSVPGRSSQLPA